MHSRSKFISPNERSNMVSYTCSIQLKSLFLIVYEILNNSWKCTYKVIMIRCPLDQSSYHQLKGHVWFPTHFQYNSSLYLSYFMRYSWKCACKVIQCTFGQGSYHQMKGHIWFPVHVQYKLSLYFSLLMRYLRKCTIRSFGAI